MTITNSQIWMYKQAPGGWKMAPLPIACAGHKTSIIDLFTMRGPDWWAGRVACVGGCPHHIFPAIVNARAISPGPSTAHDAASPGLRQSSTGLGLFSFAAAPAGPW